MVQEEPVITLFATKRKLIFMLVSWGLMMGAVEIASYFTHLD